MIYDLVIRNGTIVDGLGGEPYVGDVGVHGGVITAVGSVNGDTAEREIDATGLLITPGFVDLHTHYDGQSIWSERLTPSSAHGVTTVVMGNCGVGFAPCRQEDHDVLVDVMAGVEDIPGVVMTDGLPWSWETFPEYLNALEAGKRDIDVAAYLPHSPLRVYVMGQRGADREPATADDLAKMRALAKEARRSVRWASVVTADHPQDRKWFAHPELRRRPRGDRGDRQGRRRRRRRTAAIRARHSGRRLPAGAADGVRRRRGGRLPVTFTLVVANAGDPTWPDAINMVEKANAAGGDITAQLLPRPIGLIIGLQLTANPFVLYPSYQEIAHLPLAERVAEMRKPEVRARILADKPGQGHPILYVAQMWDWIFPLGDNPNYEPNPVDSIGARARARGVNPMEEAYDRLLDDEGRAMLLVATSNMERNSLNTVGELLHRDDVVLGLGDGGAHYGMICDASYSTFFLSHWARDRASGRFTLPEAVRELTSVPARVAGLADRGRIEVGYKADLNVIDHAGLRLHKPVITYDLPAGGRRLDQTADGYVATIVSGEVIAEHGKPTDARPGKLIRGRQTAPAPTP